MHRGTRVIALVVLLAFAGALSACSDFDVDKLDIFGLTDKKKIPGERKELFPNGVPGVTQGVPPEYMKGYVAPPDTTETPLPGAPDAGTAKAGEPQGAPNPQANAATNGGVETKTAVIEPVEKPKAKPKPKKKPQTAAKQPPAQPASAKPALEPWPTGTQPAAQPAPSPWPASAPAANTSPWPAAPPPGSFSH
jgi:hypothetical protein